MSDLDYSSVDWHDVFEYSENSPSGLFWLKNKGIKKVGSVAGSRTWSDMKKIRPKCWDVRLDGVLYKAHRIIWTLFEGSCDPNLVINHIDCNPFNNRASNLELVTDTDNIRRALCHSGVPQKDNFTGTNGVGRYLRKEVLKGYTAYCTNLDGTKTTHTFTFDQFGEALAEHLAKECRLKMIETLNSLGAGYKNG